MNLSSKYILSNKNSFFFAFQLKNIIAIIDSKNLSEFNSILIENQNNNKKFVEALIGRNFNSTFELLFVTSNSKSNLFRNVEIFLICNYQDIEGNQIENQFNTIYHLLGTTFDNYTFVPIEGNKINSLLSDRSKKYIYSIHRRVIIDKLDTLKSGITNRNIGFNPIASDVSEMNISKYEDESQITYIFPFVYALFKGEDFFDDLSLTTFSDFDIRIKIQPAILTADEESFIEEQINRCEKFSQTTLQIFDTDLKYAYPTLKNIAQQYQKNLLNFLMGLKRNSALMTVEIHSKEKLTESLLHTIANYISTYKNTNDSDAYFYGGYEITEISNEVSQFQNSPILSFNQLNIIKHPLLPEKQKRLLYFFHSEEIICAFRFPPPPTEIIPNFEIKLYKDRLAPIELIESSQKTDKSGCLIGINNYKNHRHEIRINYEDMKKHIYIIGQTGTGKTTLILSMIMDLIRNGKGICVLDPHGDLFYNILGKIPESRIDDVVILDPSDSDNVIALNFLEAKDPDQKYFIANEFVGIIRRLIESEYGLHATGYFTGPMFYKYLRMMTLLVMADPKKYGTLKDLYDCFATDDKWREFVPDVIEDEQLKIFINEIKDKDFTRPGSETVSLGDYINSKLHNFVFDPRLRRMFEQKKSNINFLDLMNNEKIILINLAKGLLTEENSRFLGMLIMTKFMAAAMERVKIRPEARKDFYLFVDEFQNIATTSFTTLLSEARKFGLTLILANQFIQQIVDEKITQSIFGNVGTFICFRLGQVDANLMQQKFLPYVSSFHLTNLPNWTAYVTTLCNGKNTIPFLIETILDPYPYSDQIVNKVKDRFIKRFKKNKKH